LKLKLFHLLIVIVSLISLAQSSAVSIGGAHPHQTPISLSTLSSSPPISLNRESTDIFAVQYEPKGFHIMAYQIGMFADPSLMWNQGTSRYYFGKDFQLGMIDSNYPGTPFITQFLADP
jgi:hypothetical protein